MKEVISIIEHSRIPIVTKRNKGENALTLLHASMLAKLETRLPSNAFSWGHNAIKFTQYCGVISLGDITIEILPKIYGKETTPETCRNAMINMLHKARKLKVTRGGNASIGVQNNTLLDIFILHFCNLLYAEIMQGKILQYVQKSENLIFLKGKILIKEQLKFNTAHRDRLFCRFDELKPDNLPNQVIKFVLNSFLKFTPGVAARKKVRELLMHFGDIQDINVDLSMMDKLNIDRSSKRYKPIFDQCRLFIQGIHPDVVTGHLKCFSLLFDMNRLFEAYVAHLMKKVALKQGKQMKEQGPRKYMARRDDNNDQVFRMQPDMVFIDPETGPFAIMDAKWKILDDNKKNLGISQSDLYQMGAYANRYEIDNLTLFYPLQKQLPSPFKLHLQVSRTTVNIIPIDISAAQPPEIP